MAVRILLGDVRAKLAELPDESVHCVVTSPPYYGLRDYGIDGQIGLESTPEAYVAVMVEVFREVRRVLRSDGTCWLNLGDSYSSGGRTTQVAPTLRGKDEASGKQSYLNNFAVRPGNIAGLKPKDLIGIPWRVAFALQAPDYLGRIRNETDRAWLAALTDGEGCITILEAKSPHGSGSSFPPILQVRMCDPECIEKAMALVGSEGENPPRYPASMEGQRPAYQWRIHGRKAADTIAEIYPFLLIKRKQAIVAWNHQAVRDSYETKRGVKIPADALAKQQLCREIIQKLNQREPVDLPSWMVEPPLPVGPGWYLRQDVIWSKPNPMPESVTDRCTKAHEYLFLLSKSPRYHFDAEAISEPLTQSSIDRLSQPTLDQQEGSWRVPGKTNGAMKAKRRKPQGWNTSANYHNADPRYKPREEAEDYVAPVESDRRNKRSVWTVATQPFKEAHFATFPPALIEPCILAGCPKGCCAKCGAPVVRQVERTAMVIERSARTHDKGQTRSSGTMVEPPSAVTTGWSPSCTCNAGTVPGTVLDCFGGAGTTGLVADRLQRDCILIELNPAYLELAAERITDDAPLFAALVKDDHGQGS